MEGLEDDRLRGLALFAAGRDWEASRVLARVFAAGIRDAEIARKLGWARLALGDEAGARTYMQEALATAPGAWESHYALGAALRASDGQASMTAFAAALDRAPGNVECLLALSASALAQHDTAKADQYARRAITIDPARPDAWLNLGLVSIAQERLEHANDALLRAEMMASEAAPEQDMVQDGRKNLDRGMVLRLLDRVREAIQYYEARLPDTPDATAHGQYALALLTAGDFDRGWPQYEFRWFDTWLAGQRATYDRPLWRGEDLHGKTILLRCEQGVGDVLQFIRYAPLVKVRGAVVLLELRPGLAALAGAFPGIDAVFEHGKVTRDFDYWCDLMSLPLAFSTVDRSIPATVPYLRVDDTKRTRWRERLSRSTHPRIGIVWAGDPRHLRDRQRSISLGTLRPLFDIAGVSWFSLQKGAAAANLKSENLDHVVIDLDGELNDYADTAAAVDNLDLVVTVDTSVAHLAGALGKPVWVLIPTPADWRWLEHREDSPWYPSMRLFRQHSTGDWSEVVTRVAAAVAAWRDLPRRAAMSIAVAVASSTNTEERFSRLESTTRDDHRASLATACYTRVGWMQCIPSAGPAAVSLMHYGDYLQTEVDLIKRLVLRNSVIVEFGAALGYHAIALASLAGDEGQVLAVEASPILRSILRQNIERCEVKGVSVMPGGAAEVPIDALDFEQIDLLKLGDSAQVERLVAGASATIWKLRPTVFAAQGSGSSLDALAGCMIDFGYRCWSVDNTHFDPSNFNRREDDVFGGTRALALLAIPEERSFDPPSGFPTRIVAVRA